MLQRVIKASRDTHSQLGPWVRYLACFQVSLHISLWVLNLVVGETESTWLRIVAICAIAPYTLEPSNVSGRILEAMRNLTLPAIVLSAPVFMTAGLLLELGDVNPEIGVVFRRQYELIACLGIVLIMAADIMVALLLILGLCGATVAVFSFAFNPDFEILGTSWIAVTSSYVLIFTWAVSLIKKKHTEITSRTETLNSVGTSIAHELRTPLLTIKTRAETIIRSIEVSQYSKPHDKNLGPNTAAIIKEVDSAFKLIDMFLTNASPNTNAANDEFEVTNAINQAITEYPYRSTKEQVSIKTTFEETSLICGPRILFVHVIFNLLKNSFDNLGSQKQPLIQISAAVTGNKVEISYTDNGAGISRENLSHIFDPFYSGSATFGAGIGLAFCRETVLNKFGGNISCESSVGSGTRFKITLPKHAPEDCVQMAGS